MQRTRFQSKCPLDQNFPHMTSQSHHNCQSAPLKRKKMIWSKIIKKNLHNSKVPEARLNQLKARILLFNIQKRSREGTSIWHSSDCTLRSHSMTASRVSQRFSMMSSSMRGLVACTSTVWQKLWWLRCSKAMTKILPNVTSLTRYLLASISWDAVLKMSTMQPCLPSTNFLTKLFARSSAAIWHSDPKSTYTNVDARLL